MSFIELIIIILVIAIIIGANRRRKIAEHLRNKFGGQGDDNSVDEQRNQAEDK